MKKTFGEIEAEIIKQDSSWYKIGLEQIILFIKGFRDGEVTELEFRDHLDSQLEGGIDSDELKYAYIKALEEGIKLYSEKDLYFIGHSREDSLITKEMILREEIPQLEPWQNQLRYIEQCPENQDGLTIQLRHLILFAEKMGFTEAAQNLTEQTKRWVPKSKETNY